MTTRQIALLEDFASALNAVRAAYGAGPPAAEIARLQHIEQAAVSLSACAGVPKHWSPAEREGLLYLRRALHGEGGCGGSIVASHAP